MTHKKYESTKQRNYVIRSNRGVYMGSRTTLGISEDSIQYGAKVILEDTWLKLVKNTLME